MPLTFADLSFWAWLRLLAGLAFYLLPGVLWARLLPGPAWLWAPVIATTLVAAPATLLSWLGVPLTWWMTALIILAASAYPAWRGWIPRYRIKPGLLIVMVWVGIIHAGPHIDGGDGFGDTIAGWAGGHDGRIVHVDEMVHVTWASAMAREETAHPDNPFTDAPSRTEFSLNTVHERVFRAGLAQIHQVSGVPLPALAAWGPMFVAALLAGMVAQASPRPLVSAAAAGLIPTTLMFLGPGYLVPIAVGLWWPVATYLTRNRRIAPWVLTAAAFGVHLIAGAACLVIMVVALVERYPRLVWPVGAGGVGGTLTLWRMGWLTQRTEDAWGRHVFTVGGVIVPILGVAGAVVAMTRSGRGAAVMTLGALASVAWSLIAGYNGLVTYYRAVPILFLGLAIHAGHGFALVQEKTPQRYHKHVTIGLGILVAIGSLGAATNHAGEPTYEVWDDASWHALEVFTTHAEPGQKFLSHPWQALLLAHTGAQPHTYLITGVGPSNQDHIDYQSRDEQWYRGIGIDWVIGPWAPGVPHVEVAPGVYRITLPEDPQP